MDAKQLDSVNIFLLLVSLVIAIFIPFKLFLFSYAVLGPLHYLTEINWLKEKNYYLQSSSKWALVFLCFAVLISIAPILYYLKKFGLESLDGVRQYLDGIAPVLILSCFLFAITLLFVKKQAFIGSAFLLTLVVAVLVSNLNSEASILFGLFLPTVIHVYLFTFFFILYGALKSKSKMGLFLSLILLSIPFILSLIPLDFIQYRPSQKVQDTYVSSSMLSVSSSLAYVIQDIDRSIFKPLSEIGIRIHIFIAFAYTYHYLNWFSKTSIIGWKKAITKQKAIVIGSIWLVSVALYYFNYRTGFIALFFLSYLHVFLEFPLNVLTIKEVFGFKTHQ